MYSLKIVSGLPSYVKCMLKIICFSLLGLTGCAPPYPPDLPHLNQVDESYGKCPEIAGRYNDKGDVISQEGKVIGKISLTRLLHGGEDPLYEAVNSIVIVGPINDLVDVYSLKDETAVLRWQQSRIDQKDKDLFACARGYVVLGLSHYTGGYGVGGMGAGIAMGGMGNRGLWCRRAVDGSLIILDWSVDAGWIVFIPYWVKSTVWYRFPPDGN